MKYLNFLLIILSLISCGNQEDPFPTGPRDPNDTDFDGFYFGADLSYVNEMEDCGAVYKDRSGTAKDP